MVGCDDDDVRGGVGGRVEGCVREFCDVGVEGCE